MRSPRGLAHRQRLVSLRPLRFSGLCDSRYGFPSHQEAPATVVPSNVVRDKSKAGHERLGPEKGVGAGKLRNGMDMAAQATACDGSTWPRPPIGDGGSR